MVYLSCFLNWHIALRVSGVGNESSGCRWLFLLLATAATGTLGIILQILNASLGSFFTVLQHISIDFDTV